MKANEITTEDRERWKKNGYFPVVCRLCDDVMLYPFPTYKHEMFIGWECQECKRRFK